MQRKNVSLFQEFFESEKASGIILIFCTLLSLLLANSATGENYLKLWHTVIGFKVGSFELYKSLEYWVNEGLMAIFFLLVGLEIERELYIGELSTGKKARLPIFAALGGMLFPALFYAIFNYGTPTALGFGIPMATDIAFSLGILALLGPKIPVSLKIFLTALAIIDDLGSIIIIAIFYVSSFSISYLLLGTAVYIVMIVLNRFKIKTISVYLVLGAILWYFLLKSGIHASITGVLVAFVIPFNRGSEKSPSRILQHSLHFPVTFLILPLFALANTGIIFTNEMSLTITAPNSLGIMAGLIFGKPIGIFFICLLAVKLGWASLASDISFKHIFGVGLLAGIGFTMSIFVTVLAFNAPVQIVSSKLAVLISSTISGLAGYFWIKFTTKIFPNLNKNK